MSQLLLDHEPTGESLKRQGIQQVSEHNPRWTDRALEALRHYARIHPHSQFDAANFRIWCMVTEGYEGLMPPPHPNALGSVFCHAARQGVIRATGTVRKSTLPDAHARLLQVWEPCA